MQLPTGAGKTIIFSEMAKAAKLKGGTVWIVVPRNELLMQSSESLEKIGVAHGRIAAGVNESLAYHVHCVSKDTLIRRYDKIKRKPDFIIVDEAHLALDRYIEIADMFSESKILGVTATPERLDGRGLSELYDTLVMGPSFGELIEHGYLTTVKYYSPPIDGIGDLHRRGTEYAPDELEDLLLRRKVYGRAIDHYRRHANGKPCLVFCRTVKAASETAQRFCDAGYKFENIDGTMSYKQRQGLISALRDGKIQGLTSCELVTYGLDVPRVECVIMLRPTLSRTLYMQMIGRGLRPYENKSECVVLDHVCNLQTHGHPFAEHDWQFYGTEKRGKKKVDPGVTLRLCPEIDFLYCEKRSCDGCPHNTTGRKSRKIEEIEGQLREVENPVKLANRPFTERRQYIDRINGLVDDYRNSDKETKDERKKIVSGVVGDMITIATALNRKPLWIYFQLTDPKDLTVNVTLLHEIARQKNFKVGWVYFCKRKIEEEKEKIEERRKENAKSA
jgi:superfamily II DNA or RNA helicase